MEASPPVHTTSTFVCAGANPIGGGASHGIVTVGLESSTSVGPASTVGGNTKGTEEASGASHGIVAAGIDARSSAGL